MNPISKKRELRVVKIIEAIKDSHGLLTFAAKKVGCSYWTIWNYSKQFPSVVKAIEESRESMLDFTESKLYEKIKGGDNACIIFYLKTQGKARGFIERQEWTGESGKPIQVEVDAKGKLLSLLNINAARGEAPGSDKPAQPERS